MSYETILFHEAHGIATITLNRPDVMNGLNAAMRREITAAVTEAGARARVIVLIEAEIEEAVAARLAHLTALDKTWHERTSVSWMAT